jgi:hypothetical protein
MRWILIGILTVVAGVNAADGPVRLVEDLSSSREYRVISEARISGELISPGSATEKKLERIAIKGRSLIDYAERPLPVDPKEADFKVLRVYDKVDFKKTTGDRTDEMTLRSGVKRLVMMKKGHAKVPFSPDGPLTFGEIEMLRTDFVLPALTGLLPTKEVKLKETWTASPAAILELTDIERVDSGKLECVLVRLDTGGSRPLAEVNFAGTLQGINEDGPTRHKLGGKFYFDLKNNFISYIKIDGEHTLLNEQGKDAGKISGTFELIRTTSSGVQALSPEVLKTLALTPNEKNTHLLYQNAEMGIEFIHPRNWRVVRATGRQLTVDESNGAGLLVTIDSVKGVPDTGDYLREVLKDMQARGAKLTDRSSLRTLVKGVEVFSIDAEAGSEKFTMNYAIVRQSNGGAIMAARIPHPEKEIRSKEFEEIVKTFTITRKIEPKESK